MRSGRHRVIWLAAVFLALALGVVLGARVLSGPLVSGLRETGQSRAADDRARGREPWLERKALRRRPIRCADVGAYRPRRTCWEVGGAGAYPDADDGDVEAVTRLVGRPVGSWPARSGHHRVRRGQRVGETAVRCQLAGRPGRREAEHVAPDPQRTGRRPARHRPADQSRPQDHAGRRHRPRHRARRCATPASSPMTTASGRPIPSSSSPATRCPRTPATRVSASRGSPPASPRTGRASCWPAGTEPRAGVGGGGRPPDAAVGAC